jgi:hypothetical protein
MSISPLIYLHPKEVTRFVLDDKMTTRIIVPGPNEADRVREHFPREFFEKNIDPETMSSFVKKTLKQINPELSVVRKSILLRELSSVWNEKYEDKEELFFQCFKYLTEFRGYTLDSQLFKEISDKLNSDIFEGVFFLWRYMEAAELIDEQKAYALMSEKTDTLVGVNYLFWGFSNINSMQIDLLNELSRVTNVVLPIHAYAAPKLKKSDWPSWLMSEKEIDISLSKYRENLESPQGLSMSGNLEFFNKNRLGEKLEELDLPNDSIILLPGAEKSFWLNNEFQTGKLNFIEGVSSQDIELSELYRDLIFTNSSKNLKDTLVEMLKDCFECNVKNYKKIKVITAAINYIDKWKDLTGFDFYGSAVQKRALAESLALDSPRLNLVFDFKGQSRESRKTIYDKELLLSSEDVTSLCVIYKKDFTPLKRGDVGHSSEVQSFLATLGPLLNNDFEFESINAQIRYFIEQSRQSTFLLEGDVLESDVDLKDFVESFKFNLKENKTAVQKSSKKETVNSIVEFYRPISPSSLQRYINCPRSYFLHYGEKRRDDLDMRETFLARFKGTLEHNVIGNYTFDHDELFVDELESFSKEIISRELVKKTITLDLVSIKNLELEIMKFSEAGINFIFNLKRELPSWKLSIEREIKGKEFYGTADLVIENEEYFGIVDFKRSSFGIPTKKSVMDFGEIQIPSYVGNFSRQTGKKLAFFGYFCLKEPEKSLMISNNDLLEKINNCGSYKTQKMSEDDIVLFLQEEQCFEEALVGKIKSDIEFSITPSSSDVCSFCHYHLVCPRGAM